LSSAKFLMWRNRYQEGKCVINAPAPVEDAYELNRGISRAESWPAGVTCVMDPEFPTDIELTDNLYGTNIIVVSERLRDALAGGNAADGVEFLPVSIVNHKGRVASNSYFVLNPPTTIECIDLKASKVKWNVLNKKLISTCERLVIDEKKVPAQVSTFRPRHLPMRILVRTEVAKSLEAAGLTGLHFGDLADFRG